MNLGEVKFMKNSSNLEIPVPKSAKKGTKKVKPKNEEEKEAEKLYDRVKQIIEVCDGIFAQIYDSQQNVWVSACPLTDQIVQTAEEKQALADYMIKLNLLYVISSI